MQWTADTPEGPKAADYRRMPKPPHGRDPVAVAEVMGRDGGVGARGAARCPWGSVAPRMVVVRTDRGAEARLAGSCGRPRPWSSAERR